MELSHSAGLILSFIAGLISGAVIFIWTLGWVHQEGMILVEGQDFTRYVENDDIEHKP